MSNTIVLQNFAKVLNFRHISLILIKIKHHILTLREQQSSRQRYVTHFICMISIYVNTHTHQSIFDIETVDNTTMPSKYSRREVLMPFCVTK